jgi:hypothetical protein
MNLNLDVQCKLIGICGHAGSGKDTVGFYLKEKHDNTYKLAFADPLKEAAAGMFGIDVDAFYDSELKEALNNFWGVTPRQMAQFFGTEMVRETLPKLIPEVGNNFWVHRMVQRLIGAEYTMPYDEDDVVVITDVRFQNEYDWIISQGGIIIHLTRPGADGTVGIPGHASEGGIQISPGLHNWRLINDSTLEELYAEVDNIIADANIYPFSNPDKF